MRDLGNLEEAKRFFLQALDAEPSKLDAMLNLGMTLEEMGDIDSAIVEFMRVLTIDQSNKAVLENFARLACQIKLPNEGFILSNLKSFCTERKDLSEYQVFLIHMAIKFFRDCDLDTTKYFLDRYKNVLKVFKGEVRWRDDEFCKAYFSYLSGLLKLAIPDLSNNDKKIITWRKPCSKLCPS